MFREGPFNGDKKTGRSSVTRRLHQFSISIDWARPIDFINSDRCRSIEWGPIHTGFVPF